MAIIKLNGNLITLNGKFEALTIIPSTNIEALNFDGSTYIQFADTPVFPSNTIFDITFSMYLDKDSGFAYQTLFKICDTNGPSLTKNIAMVFLDGSDLFIDVGDALKNQICSISGFADQIINVTITLDTTPLASTTILDVKFNGFSQSLTLQETQFSFEDTFRIGCVIVAYPTYNLVEATIWDLKIGNSYWWKGYPGNQNSGWTDQISNIDGTITTIPPEHLPSIQTRTITL